MSKAFLRESDLPEAPDRPPPALLPVGAKNYMTATGAERLRAELARLIETERPPLIAKGAESETKRELQALNQRIRYLEQSLRTAEVIERPNTPVEDIRFGATVTVRDDSAELSSYRIVGVDESEPERGWISWLSPVARALLSAKLGDRVAFQAPGGKREVEVVAIAYA